MEANDFVDGLTARLREEDPDKVPAHMTGCRSAALLLAATGLASVWLLMA